MNKWDVLAFVCLAFALSIGFGAFDWLFSQADWRMVIKFFFYGLGGYLLWNKGNWFSLKKEPVNPSV